MKFATVRNLKNQTSEMLRLAAKGTDVLITSHGKPVAMLHGLGEEDVEDFGIEFGAAQFVHLLEHLLFGRSNDELVRRMPCSIMLVKKEAESIVGED